MQKITLSQYACAAPLVDACQLNGHLTFAYAVLDGIQSGQIYIDHPKDPTWSIICNDSGFFLAFGRPPETGFSDIIQQLRQEPLVEENSVLFGTSPAWDAAFLRILEPLHQSPVRRFGFQYRPPTELHTENLDSQIPEGFDLVPIDSKLANLIFDGTGTGGFGIDPWFIRVAGGPQRYASRGLGMALLEGKQIASLCGYCSIARGEVELEVGTAPAYRGMGLATLVSAAFLEQCFSKNLQPVYTCASENKPSLAVAHKLGFVEVEEILGFKV